MIMIVDYKINNSSYTRAEMYLIDMIGLRTLQKIPIVYRKMLEINVAQNLISEKNIIGRISPCTPRVELEGSIDFRF